MNVKRPHRHHAVTYAAPGSDTEISFQSMLAAWYSVADILRTKPAGTVIRYQQGYLLMGEMNDELFMFESMDLNTESTAIDFSMFRPEDFDGIDETEFDQVKLACEAALDAGLEFVSIAPDVVAKAINRTYNLDKPSLENWVWDGATDQA